ncbi:MAG: hypothetical protein ACHQ7N_20720 [Candidatus Methylomirabilales bacterium]
MRMYELWKLPKRRGEPVRLEDAGGPVLFQRVCDAEECSRAEADFWETEFQIAPVQVGMA